MMMAPCGLGRRRLGRRGVGWWAGGECESLTQRLCWGKRHTRARERSAACRSQAAVLAALLPRAPRECSTRSGMQDCVRAPSETSPWVSVRMRVTVRVCVLVAVLLVDVRRRDRVACAHRARARGRFVSTRDRRSQLTVGRVGARAKCRWGSLGRSDALQKLNTVRVLANLSNSFRATWRIGFGQTSAWGAAAARKNNALRHHRRRNLASLLLAALLIRLCCRCPTLQRAFSRPLHPPVS